MTIEQAKSYEPKRRLLYERTNKQIKTELNKPDMKWKFQKIDWRAKGLCWSWLKIRKNVYCSGNQIQFLWGRFAFVFERQN